VIALACSRGANGCKEPNSGQVSGIISVVAFSFIRAGAERNHRAVEREVAIAELAHVAQHLGLRAMCVEHRVGEEEVARFNGLRQRLARGRI